MVLPTPAQPGGLRETPPINVWTLEGRTPSPDVMSTCLKFNTLTLMLGGLQDL